MKYEVQRGDSLPLIAGKFTGNMNRWQELLAANPQLPKTTNNEGQRTFVASYFQVGQLINLPSSWTANLRHRVDGLMAGPWGHVGEGSCSPDPVTPHPLAWYKIQSGDLPAQVAYDRFGKLLSDGVHGDFKTLMGANSGDPGGFTLVNNDCVMARWKAGELIRVPKDWLDVSEQAFFPKKALPFLYLADGVTKWTPGTGNVPPTGGACPEGYVQDPQTGLCVKGTGTKVSATDEGFKLGSIGWLALAAVAGIGAALVVVNLTKSKKVHGAPPALPAHKDEVVVRR